VTTIANHRVYNAYGVLESQTNAAVDCLFGYTGRPFDKASGEQYNGGRWYEAITGRWLSEDPSKFAAGDANLNRYVGNSPLNRRDPTGLDDSGGMVNMSRPPSGPGGVGSHGGPGAPGASGSGGGGGAGGGGGCGCGGYVPKVGYDKEDIDGQGPAEGDLDIFYVPICKNGCGGSYNNHELYDQIFRILSGHPTPADKLAVDGGEPEPVPQAPPFFPPWKEPFPFPAPNPTSPKNSAPSKCSIGPSDPNKNVQGTLAWAIEISNEWDYDRTHFPHLYNVSGEDAQWAYHILQGMGTGQAIVDQALNPAFSDEGCGLDQALAPFDRQH
jgi:RHS repeat-associated protein